MTEYISKLNDRVSVLSKGVDDSVDNWFLMSSPGPVVSIIIVYLLFVLKIGPYYMKDRKPYDLKKLMVLYNAFQVCFSFYLCRIAIHESNVMSSIFSTKCEIKRNRQQTLTLYSGAWFYFFSKVVDLLDTTFFVLRKKNSQISFLHVYHHTITVLFSWGYLKYAPGEQGVIIGILNSFVHIVMYFYYMVAALGPQYQKYLWWKKYMTTIQLLQFVLILGYMILVAAKGCNMPKALTIFFVVNTIIFLYLFGNFYRKTYNQQKNKNKSGGDDRNGSGGGGEINKFAQSVLRAAGGMGCGAPNEFVKKSSSSSGASGASGYDTVDTNNNHLQKTTKKAL